MRDVATSIALNRFGLGAMPGEAEAIGGDPRGWVATQIDRRAAPAHVRRTRVGRHLGGDAPRRDRGTRTAARDGATAL